jgi:IS4 transposase
MPRRRESHIRRAMASVLAPRRIRTLARELGVVRRRRKVDIVALVSALVLGFSAGNRRTLAGLRRAYERATRTTLVPSAFYDRFTAPLVRLLKRLVEQALKEAETRRPRLLLAFDSFRQVLAADGSVVRLHEALAGSYPSIWTNHMPASAKLHVVMNVVGRGPSSVQITHGSRHDLRLLHPGKWMRDKLLIFDLGYFQGLLFRAIGANGGFFLGRLKQHVNPKIVASSRPEHERFVGRQLLDVLPRLSRDTIDFETSMNYRILRGRRRGYYQVPVRVVGVWNAETKRHHLYVTNVPRLRLAADHIAGVYAARWEVELLFRELKTHYRIDDLRSCSRHVTEALLYASLLTLLLSRRLYRLLTPEPHRFPQKHPLDRWAGLFASLAHDFLELLVGPASLRSALASRLRRFLFHEARDPNRHRLLLAVRAQLGLLATKT